MKFEKLNASVVETSGKKRVRFEPAYSGGLMFTDGIGIPEGVNVGEEFYPPGTKLPAVCDLETVRFEQNLPILYSHNAVFRLGHTEKVENDGKSIIAEGILDSPSEWVREVVESFKAGARWQASIGSGMIDVKDKQLVKAGETVNVNGQELSGPFTLLRNLHIREISIVPAGADPETDVLLASAQTSEKKKKGSAMNFEEFAASAGFQLETLDEANRTALEALYLASNAEEIQASEETKDEESVQASEETEEEKVQASETSEEDEKIQASAEEEDLKASEEEKTGEKVQAGAVKGLSRIAGLRSVNVPRSFSRPESETPKRSDVLQASALMSLGVPEKWLTRNGYSPRTIDAAEKEKDVTLLSIMGEALKASNVRVDYRDPKRIVEDFKEVLKSSNVSTRNFGEINVFSPIIDKQMRYRYERLESIWKKLFRERKVRDFNKVATVNFDVLGRAKDLAEMEDFPNVSLQSGGEEFAVSKQGVIAAISFESQINDDMGALDIIGDELLNMIVDVQVDKFWSVFWGKHSANFTARKGNRITEPLSIAGLTAAKKAFGSRKNANGRFVNIPAKYLLVPLSLEDEALSLFQWKWGEGNFEGNIHVGKYEVLTDPYLGTEGGYAGASDSGWFMLGDTARYPLGEYAVLNGYESPKIQESWYDHKDALNLRALGTIGFHAYSDNLPAVYSDGSAQG